MSRLVIELQAVLTNLVEEHRALLTEVQAQHEAMKTMNMATMAELMNQQEATRQKINALDQRRRLITRQLTVNLKLTTEPTLKRLAELFPPQAPGLLKTREELREVVMKISQRVQVSAKLTSAVLGHLNTVMKILASAVERAGLYTRQGVPRIASRLGVMDAVG